MIKSIFFCRFLPKEGPRVVHQVPSNSITPSAASTATATAPPPLFDFDALSSFLIPRQELCDRLVSVAAGGARVLGFPVRIQGRRYARNEFIFNFAIVLPAGAGAAYASSYLSVVRKLAMLFRSLEEQGGFLSREDGGGGGAEAGEADATAGQPSSVDKGKVYALCEIVLEDLNNYCECMIPIDESNTINIKLFPLYPPPPSVKAWHVPLSTVRLDSLMDVNWDLTMQRAVPFINGINSVRRISELADADYKLVKKCIEHLLYYGCLLMLDIFQFSAIYAPTAEIGMLFEDVSMQEECATYIAIGGPPLPTAEILALYASLHTRLPMRAWCVEHATAAATIDIRRFITFGCIKGFLYRVHKYAIAPSSSGDMAVARQGGQQRRGPRGVKSGDASLKRFLNGQHCFDEACSELGWSEKELMKKLKAMGDVQVIHR